jgi:hypothetical protein
VYLGGTKGSIDPSAMILFRSADKRIREAPTEEWDTDDDGEPIPRFIAEYAASAAVICDRLNLMGYTLDHALRAFAEAVVRERADHAELMESVGSGWPEGWKDTKGSVLESLDATAWLSGLREIADRNLAPWSLKEGAGDSLSPLLHFMLDQHADGWYGLIVDDIRVVIRLAVEAIPDGEFIYDLTDLVYGGYYDSSDDLVADAEYLIAADFALSRRIVVLTEGANDKWILERSLKLLRPHLADYFAFMDFEGAKVAGGAHALAQMVKAFAGAGILNRVLAVFDNDTAGTDAVVQLSSISLPPNIVVVQLPPLDIARAYPTVGPSGTVRMDVNGLAAGIELYLGRDVLEIEGEFVPVQWRGLNERLGKYQGEPLRKTELHRRFSAKLDLCETTPDALSTFDWSGLECIAQALCNALNSPVAQYDGTEPGTP